MKIKRRPELRARVRWQSTGDLYFPWAADLEGVWWVLRLNSWPDHPMYTLFVAGSRRLDLDDIPPRWKEGESGAAELPEIDVATALRPVRALLAYGSEVGQPCANPFCCG
ncbi:hypothetical protein K8Z61_04330 [Nocardioides sp. TRM66260-LWL]|uniref:hypothetical protein n=1 Tax=Nocardioides sp. TRM66260-LWL TaxID=2874478 RepID=UPI001CC4B73C|nr:hypothetical protein [Nocardioides sp. TRM66260-LWL]MBZ5733715.1 hypothetical protein [Nocardioides sp. TRM66260-LWL]